MKPVRILEVMSVFDLRQLARNSHTQRDSRIPVTLMIIVAKLYKMVCGIKMQYVTVVTSECREAGQSVARVTRESELAPVRHVGHVTRDTCRVTEAGHVTVTRRTPGDTWLPFPVPTSKLVTTVL